jgi:hypothetical protein
MFNANGINTYSIGLNGALTFVSGPVFPGQGFDNLTINAKTSILIAQYNGYFETASIDPSTGFLTAVSSFASPCSFAGPVVLDPSERFIYLAQEATSPGIVCGLTMDTAGNLGAISGQTFPITITGSTNLYTGVAVQLKVKAP